MQADKVKAYHNMADCPNRELKRMHATGYLTCYTCYTVTVLRIRAFIGLFVSLWLIQISNSLHIANGHFLFKSPTICTVIVLHFYNTQLTFLITFKMLSSMCTFCFLQMDELCLPWMEMFSMRIWNIVSSFRMMTIEQCHVLSFEIMHTARVKITVTSCTNIRI